MRTTLSRRNPARRSAAGRQATAQRPSREHVRAARRVEVAHERERAAPLAAIDATTSAWAALTPRERAKVTSGQSVPNAPLRAAALAWIEQEHRRRRAALGDTGAASKRRLVTLNELLAIAALENTHGRRVLGLCPYVEPARGRTRAARTRYAQILRRDYALRLIAAMNLYPVDLGL